MKCKTQDVKVISYARLQHRFGGKFIARTDGHVVASATTYRKLLQVIQKLRVPRQTLTVGYVPPKDARRTPV